MNEASFKKMALLRLQAQEYGRSRASRSDCLWSQVQPPECKAQPRHAFTYGFLLTLSLGFVSKDEVSQDYARKSSTTIGNPTNRVNPSQASRLPQSPVLGDAFKGDWELGADVSTPR